MEDSYFTSERLASGAALSEPPAPEFANGASAKGADEAPPKDSGVFHGALQFMSQERHQFIDITQKVVDLARESGIQNGLVNIQTRHTTTAIVINEAEPLLLEDLKGLLDRIAAPGRYYRHNDFSIRTVNMEEEETGNGHSHCQALFLRASETLNLADGRLQLGKWQRVFFVELDHARERTVSVLILGQ
jgi:secondary thiamine-phosphate synthase enzyme